MFYSRKKLIQRKARREIYSTLSDYRDHLRKLHIEATFFGDSGQAQRLFIRMQAVGICMQKVAECDR